MKRVREPSPDQSVKLPKREQDTTSSLGRLLDFSSSTLVSHTEISAQFDTLAGFMLHEYTLCARVEDKEIEYEILELEFYLYKSGSHEDPFTHQTNEQKHTGRWYFHRVPTRWNAPARGPAGGYRGGTRKGLDLNLGSPITSSYFPSKEATETVTIRGGILLRTIRRIRDKKIISGPSLLVDEILSASNADDISDLVQNKWGNDTTALPSTASSIRAPPSLYMKKRPGKKESSQVYRTPRIGLELSHPSTKACSTDPRVMYISKPYRYIVHPSLLTSNGRPQTFLGIYRSLADSGEFENKGRLAAEVARVTGIKEGTVLRYIADFRYGVEGKCSLASFVGTKNGTSSVSQYLNMMGALRALENSAL